MVVTNAGLLKTVTHATQMNDCVTLGPMGEREAVGSVAVGGCV